MSFLLAFSRLSVRELSKQIRNFNSSNVLLIQTTPALCAEPLKKKKKLDPQIVKQREERRRRKLEKQIRRLEKNSRQLKPIEELEIPVELIDEKEKRKRTVTPLSAMEIEKRALLNKEWARYKHNEKLSDFQTIDRILQSEKRALEELRKESEELYQQAIQPDPSLIPITLIGPVSTPPIQNYDSPDGEYINLPKNWEINEIPPAIK